MEAPHTVFGAHGDGGYEKAGLPLRPRLKTAAIASIPTRKPVGTSQSEADDSAGKTNDLDFDPFESPPPFYEEDGVIFDSPSLVQSPTSASTSTSPSLVQSPCSASTSDSPSGEPSKWKTAMGEVRHFAGGLISHPFESTKHFSILRHSHGLVFYKGPATSLAITIFSDKPLPPGRPLWVQRKGWTGKTGMKVKGLLHTNSSWINVTPSGRAEPSDLPPADERAWQRDISKFLKKVPQEIRHHRPRETDVLRIPASVEDGYFRVVLCAGERSMSVLCPSPVFRVASTSASSSSIRGASLSTLPLEIGIKVLSSAAVATAGNVISPIASAVETRISQCQPVSVGQQVAAAAYGATGMQAKIDKANQQYSQARHVLLQSDPSGNAGYSDLAGPELVRSPSGPELPFPIRISSKIVPGTGRSTAELGLPTVNLADPPEDVLYPLFGVYFGWACISTKTALPLDVLETWQRATITIAPCPYTAPSITPKKVIKAHLLHDFHGAQIQYLGARISLLILGFLRPVKRLEQYHDHVAMLDDMAKDIAATQASLSPDREAWSAEACINRLKLTKESRSMSERYADLRQAGQRQVERVPLHKIGIRSPGAIQRDQMVVHGNGGFYVLRDAGEPAHAN